MFPHRMVGQLLILLLRVTTLMWLNCLLILVIRLTIKVSTKPCMVLCRDSSHTVSIPAYSLTLSLHPGTLIMSRVAFGIKPLRRSLLLRVLIYVFARSFLLQLLETSANASIVLPRFTLGCTCMLIYITQNFVL